MSAHPWADVLAQLDQARRDAHTDHGNPLEGWTTTDQPSTSTTDRKE